MAKKRIAQKSNGLGTGILSLILFFVAGFAVFSLLGFVVIIILLSTGVIPPV